MPSILFVCTGNICRSPTAEAIFRDRALKLGLADVDFDSVGVHGYHAGELPDYRSIETAQSHGVDMNGLQARQLISEDFERFDLLIAMDKGHEQEMLALCGNNAQHQSKVKLLLDYHPEHQRANVPDPYYGDMAGFERTYKLIESGVGALIAEVFA